MRLHVLHWYPNCLCGGGIANAVLALARGQVQLGAAVVIAAAEPSGPPLYGPLEIDHGVTVVAWRPTWTWQIPGAVLRWAPRDAISGLRTFAPDVVHVHGAFTPDNLRVPFLFKCPLVFSPHGGLGPKVLVKSRRIAKRLYFQVERRMFHRRVRAYHALSPAEASHIDRLLPGSRVYCAPHGASTFTELSQVGRIPTAQRDARVRFVFVGRLDVFTKGLDILLEAFADAERRLRGHDLSLMLVGPEWKGSLLSLKRRGEELGIAHRVVFTGALASHELASALRESDVYVQLSRHDAFALSVSDALLAGKPAILSREVGATCYAEVASLPHVRIVPPRARDAADAMVDFADRIGELREMAEQYRGQVGDFFSWDRVAGLHLEMYEKVNAASADGRPRWQSTRHPVR